MERDKAETRKRILEALGRLLSESGFPGIGINAVAREAKVSKVLIYRYFGGWPELLRAFAEDRAYWPSSVELLGGKISLRRITNTEQMSATILINYLKEMRRRRVTQEIIRWALIHKNELTEELSKAREKQGAEILSSLPLDPAKYQDIDLAAAAALLHAGVTYLVLHSRAADEYLGIDLHSNFGWKRLEKAIESLINGYFAQHRTGSEMK